MMLRAAFLPPEPVLEELRVIGSRIGGLPGVQPTPPDGLEVLIAGFGNVSETDAHRLRDALTPLLLDQPAPVVHFAGLDLDDDDVLAVLAGDVDQLASIARLVGRAAESLNIYVDRRRFRPALRIASIGQVQRGSAVPAIVSGTLPWEGTDWDAGGVSLVRTRWTAAGAISEEVAFVELGHPVEQVAEA